MKEGGLALSTAISAIVQIIILTIILQNKLRIKVGREAVVSILKTVTASVAMAIACWFVLRMFPASDGSGSLYFKGLRLFAPMAAAFAAFAGASILLKSEEFGHLVRLSIRKK